MDELLAKPEWVDKWTMFYGDLYQNTDTRPSTALRRFPQGRNAFYQYIHDGAGQRKTVQPDGHGADHRRRREQL